MESVDPIKNKGAFRKACKDATLEDEEIDWLWAYLENCDAAVYGKDKVRDVTLPAAQSGW